MIESENISQTDSRGWKDQKVLLLTDVFTLVFTQNDGVAVKSDNEKLQKKSSLMLLYYTTRKVEFYPRQMDSF